MAVKYSKWSKNMATFSIPRPSNFTQIIFWGGLKVNHLATLLGLRECSEIYSNAIVQRAHIEACVFQSLKVFADRHGKSYNDYLTNKI
jgi:hypothetical protein